MPGLNQECLTSEGWGREGGSAAAAVPEARHKSFSGGKVPVVGLSSGEQVLPVRI